MLEIKLLSSAAHLSAKTREEAERALEEREKNGYGRGNKSMEQEG